jgi:hypothetical protein
MRSTKFWQPIIPLSRYFTPTNESLSGERRKAKNKNLNLTILQYMYNGNAIDPLRCLLSGAVGWVDYPCVVSNTPKQRFNIDFNHIRQQSTDNRIAGSSKDKGDYDPSSIFRNTALIRSELDLIEFMCIIPVSQEYHRYITQDSAMGDITLTNFPVNCWPWFLKSKSNFSEFTHRFQVGIHYEWFIDHLSDIRHPGIRNRIASPYPGIVTGLTPLAPDAII